MYTRDWQARFVYTQRNDIRMEGLFLQRRDAPRHLRSQGVNEARAARAQAR